MRWLERQDSWCLRRMREVVEGVIKWHPLEKKEIILGLWNMERWWRERRCAVNLFLFWLLLVSRVLSAHAERCPLGLAWGYAVKDQWGVSAWLTWSQKAKLLKVRMKWMSWWLCVNLFLKWFRPPCSAFGDLDMVVVMFLVADKLVYMVV